MKMSIWNISPNMAMNWQPVDEKIFTKTINGCSLFHHTPKPIKKIKRQTLRLNCELKKFAGLKSYSQYVKTKTIILRDISDNDDTEDEMYNSDKEYDVLSQSQCRRVHDRTMLLSVEQTNSKPKTTRKKYVNASNISSTSFDNAERSKVQKKSPNKRKSHEDAEDIDTACNHQQDRLHETRTNARRNLTALLENFHENIADPIIDVGQSTQMLDGHWDYANNSTSNNNNNNNNNNDSDDNDENVNDNDSDGNGDSDDGDRNVRDIDDRESHSPYAPRSCSRSGDLGIDDDSQNSLFIDNQTHDIMAFDDDDKPIVTRTISESNNEKEMRDDDDEEAVEEEEEEKLSVVADETHKQKSQPTITSTAIVKSKYKIIRDENEKDESQRLVVDRSEIVTQQDGESSKLDGPSPESRRLGQLKRINLMSSGSSSSSSSNSDTESDCSRANDNTKYSEATYLQSSRIIGQLSDSDESIGSNESAERSQNTSLDNGQSLQTSNDDDGIRGNNVATAAEKRTIKCQIEEQESLRNAEPVDKFQSAPTTLHYSSPSKTNKILAPESDDSPIKKKRRLIDDSRTITTATDPHSRGYASSNSSTGSINEDPLLDNTNNINNNNNNNANTNETEYDGELDETSCRPTELMDFITSQGLIATPKLSTITIEDVAISGEKDEDDEIWLLEIPKMIARDDELRGQSLSLGRTNMRIGRATYDIIRRYDKSVSIILPIEKKEKARYQIANIVPAGSIQLTRCESTNEEISTAERQDRGQDEANVNGENVAPPRFPNNLKSRNPLMSMEGENGKGNDNNVKHKKSRRAKNLHRLWHIENFLSK